MNQASKGSQAVEIPGLVDLQVNGYKGVDFSQAGLTQEAFVRACRGLIEAGTTAFLPTMVTSPVEVYRHNLGVIASVMEMGEFEGRLLGIHLEGPFISGEPGTRGAHNVEWVVEPDIELLERLNDWAGGHVKMVTVAAELPGAEELARHAVDKGMTVALGHQAAEERDLARLVAAGATALTHLGNGIPAMVGRHHNPVWAGLGNDELAATIITDGNHLPPAVLKTIIRTKGPGRCIVISDATSLAGFEPGTYRTLGHTVVLEPGGRVYDPRSGYMCGSSATMLKCMNHLASLRLAELDQMVAMGFYNPLALIGLDAAEVAGGPAIVFERGTGVFGLRG